MESGEKTFRNYANSFFKTMKDGCTEIVEKGFHYPLCAAGCMTFLDMTITEAGILNGISREINPMSIYLQTSANLPPTQSMLIVTGMSLGIITAGAFFEEYMTGFRERVEKKNGEDMEKISGLKSKIVNGGLHLQSKLINADDYRLTRFYCLAKIVSGAAAISTGMVYTML
jgi:hypothetical protein